MKPRAILLVDDTQDDVDLTLRALRKCKVLNEIIVARDGVEALDYMFGRGAYQGRDTNIQPQLVLMDLKMPRLGGLEALKQMRADSRTHNVPVVILTSSKDEADLVVSYNLGANSFVRKPVDFLRFTEVVEHLNLYWLVLNEVPPVCTESRGDQT